ncbi:MAG: hypothetical protein WD875_02810 [Pirellulales bacterium]
MRLCINTRVDFYLAMCLAALTLAPATGCLSLGGSTTHVHENPETQARVTSLESRVSTLEQAVLATSVHEIQETSASTSPRESDRSR